MSWTTADFVDLAAHLVETSDAPGSLVGATLAADEYIRKGIQAVELDAEWDKRAGGLIPMTVFAHAAHYF